MNLFMSALLSCSVEPNLGVAQSCGFADIDEDGFGDSSDEVEGRRCNQVPVSSNSLDCDDSRGDTFPGAVEVPYDGSDNDCNPITLDDDLDRDGFGIVDDCDDADATLNPSADELPYDGIDNDCDPLTPDDDLDRDGVGIDSDCDDEAPAVQLSGEIVAETIERFEVEELCRARCAGQSILRGNIDVEGSLPDLSGFSCLFEVDGSVALRSTTVNTLAGLDHLQRVTGNLTIEEEPDLTTLAGLDGLESVGGAFRLANNLQLPRATTGLDGLSTVGSLIVTDNPLLSDESGRALADQITVTTTTEIARNGRWFDFPNPGFELALPDGRPAEYLVFPGGPTDAFVDASEASSGLASLRIRPTTLVAGPVTVYRDHVSEIVPGQSFEITGFALVSGTDPLTPSCEAFLVLKYFSANFGSFLGWSLSPLVDSTSPLDTWTPLTLAGTVPPGGAILQAGVEMNYSDTCQGSVFWDDLTLRLTNL